MAIRIFLKQEEIIFLSIVSVMLLFSLIFIFSYPGKEKLEIFKKKYMKEINNPQEKNINKEEKNNRYDKKNKRN